MKWKKLSKTAIERMKEYHSSLTPDERKKLYIQEPVPFENREPQWVCLKCADERGARIPEGHCYSMHTDICGICRQTKSVTEPRDFGMTRSLLRV